LLFLLRSYPKGHTTQRKFASKITGKVDCSALDIISEKVIVLNKKTFSLLMYFYLKLVAVSKI
jgi:hypothetical protein